MTTPRVDGREVVIAPLAGGRAALRPFARVVSYAVEPIANPSPLERLQARRSQLIFAPSREVAVAVALRLGLGPTRFRVAPGGRPDMELVARELSLAGSRRRMWHST